MVHESLWIPEEPEPACFTSILTELHPFSNRLLSGTKGGAVQPSAGIFVISDCLGTGADHCGLRSAQVISAERVLVDDLRRDYIAAGLPWNPSARAVR